MNYRQSTGWAIAGGILMFVADRLSKHWALTALTQPMAVTSWLSFSPTLNRGISFGIFDSKNMSSFILVSSVVIALLSFVCVLAYKNYRAHLSIFGHVLVLAGGFSNLIDRIIHAGVVDFVALSYQTWQWPTFNIADVAINLGVFIILLQSIRS